MHKNIYLQIFITGLFLTINFNSFSQKNEPINTDRPDQSDGVYILLKNNFQIETGFVVGKETEKYFVSNTMLRFGIFKKTEVRLLFDYGKIGEERGVMPTGISVKQNIFHQKGWLPEITAVGYLRFPYLGSKNFKADNLPATFLLAFQNDISEKISIGYNAGVLYDGDNSFKNYITTVSIGHKISEKISFFYEYFAQFNNQNNPKNNCDLGILFLLSKSLQLDLAVGRALTKNDPNKFLTSGISYKF